MNQTAANKIAEIISSLNSHTNPKKKIQEALASFKTFHGDEAFAAPEVAKAFDDLFNDIKEEEQNDTFLKDELAQAKEKLAILQKEHEALQATLNPPPPPPKQEQQTKQPEADIPAN